MKDFPFDPYDFFGYLGAGLVVLFGLELVVGIPHVFGNDLKPLDLTLVVLASYVAGQLSATPAKALLESVIVRRFLQTPSVNLMRRDDQKPWLHYIFPGYFVPLPPSVQKRLLTKSKREGLRSVSGEELFLHIRFRDYIRNDVALIGRLNSFLNKYGFNRNLSFVALLFCVAVLVSTPFDMASDYTRYAMLSGLTSTLLFYRYIKFFRQYSYELFNSYAGKV